MTDFEIAAFLGVGITIVRSLKWGCREKLPKICTQRLRAAGYPGNPAADYRKWREKALKEAKQRVEEAFESWKDFQKRKASEKRDSKRETS